MPDRPHGRLRRVWSAVRRRLRRGPQRPPEPRWPDEEPALVPVGPPRRPRPGAAVALEPPAEPDPLEYPTETHAVGHPLEDRDDAEDEPGEDERGAGVR